MSIFMQNIRTSKFRRVRTVGVAQSPFTGSVQRSAMQDARFVMEIEYAPMPRPVFSPYLAAIAAQGEGTSSFKGWDPDRAIPLGGETGTFLIANNTAVGAGAVDLYSMSLSTIYAAPGDMIFFSPLQAYVIQNAITSSGTGTAQVALDLPLRKALALGNSATFAPAANEALALNFRLTGYDHSCDEHGYFRLSITAEEVL